MKKVLIVLWMILMTNVCSAQNIINPDGYNVLYYTNGKKSSEGMMKNGKPDGYWITYYESGVKKSEGNRKEFELDSCWKFYNQSGALTMEINYKKGKKNGLRKTWMDKEIVEENFVDDVKQGNTVYYYDTGKILRKIPFRDGLEDGKAYDYDKLGNIISITDYKKGFVVNKENINRFDYNGLKTGLWKDFYENGNVKTECSFWDGKKNGFYKEYSEEGNLVKIEKYQNDEKQENAPELKSYDLKYDYYPNGKVKVEGSYYNNKAEGVRREYTPEGKIEKSYVFKNGVMIGIGIVDENGWKQGAWKEYYDDGSLKQEGSYFNTKKSGLWKFYFQGNNSIVEQIGTYDNKGNPIGEWKWFYESGNIHRIENYENGMLNGLMEEKTDSGLVITRGIYLDGQEDGEWYYQIEGYREEGKYADGRRTGIWKHYYDNGNLAFEGNFEDGQPDGIHKFYWENANLKRMGSYIMGLKNGEWNSFYPDGTLFVTTLYKNGKEISYDGSLILPSLENE